MGNLLRNPLILPGTIHVPGFAFYKTPHYEFEESNPTQTKAGFAIREREISPQ
jgi:hypothetical protein